MNCGDFKSNSCVFYLDWTKNLLDSTPQLWALYARTFFSEEKDCFFVLDTVIRLLRNTTECRLNKGVCKERRNENKEEGEGEIS